MELFRVALRRDSASLLRFSFLSHVNFFFPFGVLLFCRLKCPYTCFSLNCCFLVIFVLLILVSSVLFLVAFISLPSRFLCSLRIIVSMLRRCLECWQELFLLLFFIHIFCLRCLWYNYILTFMFHSFFCNLELSKYSFIFSLSFESVISRNGSIY